MRHGKEDVLVFVLVLLSLLALFVLALFVFGLLAAYMYNEPWQRRCVLIFYLYVYILILALALLAAHM